VKVRILASDSMGTRSMATLVETDDLKLLIDPGVALGPSRYRLPPHPLEIRRLEEHWRAVKAHAKKADCLVITHYHYDHHDPEEPGLYRDRTVLVKHPTSKINKSQEGRAACFLERISGLPEKVEYSDGKEFSFGGTTVKFSEPVFHGTNSRLGYVTEVCVREGDSSFLFTSDVEGPSVPDQVEFILQEKPRVLFVDGPMTYMLGFRYSNASLRLSLENLIRVMRETPLETLILDHHLLRDLKWKERMAPVYDAGKERGVRIATAAEFMGQRNEMLEARRRELYDAKD